jgi:nucleotide-binding universal stress UspA family protein
MAPIDEKTIRRILVAIDSSKFASVVVEEAAKLATRLGSDVTILSVVNIAGLFATEGEVDSSEIDEQERDFLSLHKSLIERYFNHSAILIESKILHGREDLRIRRDRRRRPSPSWDTWEGRTLCSSPRKRIAQSCR